MPVRYTQQFQRVSVLQSAFRYEYVSYRYTYSMYLRAWVRAAPIKYSQVPQCGMSVWPLSGFCCFSELFNRLPLCVALGIYSQIYRYCIYTYVQLPASQLASCCCSCTRRLSAVRLPVIGNSAATRPADHFTYNPNLDWYIQSRVVYVHGRWHLWGAHICMPFYI